MTFNKNVDSIKIRILMCFDKQAFDIKSFDNLSFDNPSFDKKSWIPAGGHLTPAPDPRIKLAAR